MSGPKQPDAIDEAVAQVPQRDPIREAILAANPGGPGLGSGSLLKWTDGDETREGAFALFVPRDITWEAAFVIQQALGQALATIVANAEAAKPAHGLTLVRGALPPRLS